MKILKRCFSFVLLCALSFTFMAFFGSCGAKDSNFVELKIKNYGTVVIEVYPDVAPETVANFLSLVDSGFYNGLTFHRLYPGFMIQGGDPNGDGTGGSEKTIKGEFSSNGFENNLSHERGVVSMARAKAPDSASSQFFICVDDATYLDGDYAAFGRVVDGMDVADKIVEDIQNAPAHYSSYTDFLSRYFSSLPYYSPDELSSYVCQYSNGAVLPQYQPVITSAKRVKR